jgi:hypothetical protein
VPAYLGVSVLIEIAESSLYIALLKLKLENALGSHDAGDH